MVDGASRHCKHAGDRIQRAESEARPGHRASQTTEFRQSRTFRSDQSSRRSGSRRPESQPVPGCFRPGPQLLRKRWTLPESLLARHRLYRRRPPPPQLSPRQMHGRQPGPPRCRRQAAVIDWLNSQEIDLSNPPADPRTRYLVCGSAASLTTSAVAGVCAAYFNDRILSVVSSWVISLVPSLVTETA